MIGGEILSFYILNEYVSEAKLKSNKKTPVNLLTNYVV